MKKKAVSYCISCGASLLWEKEGAGVIRFGDKNLMDCLMTGCNIVTADIGDGNLAFELVRMTLLKAGIPEDAAIEIATILSIHHRKAAAA